VDQIRSSKITTVTWSRSALATSQLAVTQPRLRLVLVTGRKKMSTARPS